MFAILYALFFRKQDESHDAYLKESTDLADLERRMRQVDEADRAYSLGFCGAIPRDRHEF
jgi:hypothetical protein